MINGSKYTITGMFVTGLLFACNTKRTEQIANSKLLDVSEEIQMLKPNKLPFGVAELIKFDFSNLKETEYSEGPTSAEDSIVEKISITYDSLFYKRYIDTSSQALNKIYPNKYYTEQTYSFSGLAGYYKDTNSYYCMYALPKKYNCNVLLFKDRGGYDSLCCNEGIVILNQADLATVTDEGKVIHSIPVFYRAQRLYQNLYRYFYIDEDYIIHVKDFDLGELDEFIRYEKYQIKPNGRIVRYFDQEEGNYKTQEEQGQVRDHTQDGVWIEKKENVYPIKNLGSYRKIWLEAAYKAGVPTGQWHYYTLREDGSRGNLIMIEEYNDQGEVFKQEYKEGASLSSKNQNIADYWVGEYTYYKSYDSGPDSIGGVSIGYSVVIKKDSCFLSGAGFQTYFYDSCLPNQNKDTLELMYEKTIEGTEYNQKYKEKDIPVIKLYKRGNDYYIKSPVVSDKDWNDNVEIKVKKEKLE